MRSSVLSLSLAGCLATSSLLLLAAPAQAKPWKGAELITHQTFLYGAFEARIRAAQGSGLITPFFLWKHDSEVPGELWQEQDFEIFGSDGRYQTQLMTPGEGGAQRTEHNDYHELPVAAWERYFTYRMEWTPDYLAFYVDGELVRVETDPREYAKLLDPEQAEPAQLRVSLWAADSAWSGAFDEGAVPAATFVSFVQTYAYTPGAGPGGGDFSPLWRDEFEAPGTARPDGSRWWAANWTFSYAVNDYVEANARVKDGALVLVLTDEANVGTFPDVPADAPSSGEAPASGQGPLPVTSCEAGAAVLEAEAMRPSAGGRTSDGWNLWANGELSAAHVFGSEPAVVAVRARGDFGGGAWPHLVVSVGGQVIGDVVVSSAEYAEYEFFYAGAGEQSIALAFDNDYYTGGEDRNLIIESLSVTPICE